MKKVNFTLENQVALEKILVSHLLTNTQFVGPMGANFNVHQLLHELSIRSLETTLKNLEREIEITSDTPWEEPPAGKLTILNNKRELVHLIIGYKKNLEYQKYAAEEKKKLESQIAALTESTKTPAEKIKELEAKLKEL